MVSVWVGFFEKIPRELSGVIENVLFLDWGCGYMHVHMCQNGFHALKGYILLYVTYTSRR